MGQRHGVYDIIMTLKGEIGHMKTSRITVVAAVVAAEVPAQAVTDSIMPRASKNANVFFILSATKK